MFGIAELAASMLVGSFHRVIDADPTGAAHLSQACSLGLAGGGFLIQGLCLLGGATFGAEGEYFDLEALLTATDAQALPRLHCATGFAVDLIDLNLATIDGLLGQRTRLEEACGPQPDV